VEASESRVAAFCPNVELPLSNSSTVTGEIHGASLSRRRNKMDMARRSTEDNDGPKFIGHRVRKMLTLCAAADPAILSVHYRSSDTRG